MNKGREKGANLSRGDGLRDLYLALTGVEGKNMRRGKLHHAKKTTESVDVWRQLSHEEEEEGKRQGVENSMKNLEIYGLFRRVRRCLGVPHHFSPDGRNFLLPLSFSFFSDLPASPGAPTLDTQACETDTPVTSSHHRLSPREDKFGYRCSP